MHKRLISYAFTDSFARNSIDIDVMMVVTKTLERTYCISTKLRTNVIFAFVYVFARSLISS